jgi:hypothetical protein
MSERALVEMFENVTSRRASMALVMQVALTNRMLDKRRPEAACGLCVTGDDDGNKGKKISAASQCSVPSVKVEYAYFPARSVRMDFVKFSIRSPQ